MGRHKTDEADRADKRDGPRRQQNDREEDPDAQSPDIDAERGRPGIAEAKRCEGPNILHDQQRARADNARHNWDLVPTRFQERPEEPEDDGLQRLRRRQVLGQGLQRLEEEKRRNAGKDHHAWRHAAQTCEAIDEARREAGHGEGRRRRRQFRRERQRHADQDR